MGTARIIGLDAAKNDSEKAFQKTAEEPRELIGYQTTKKIVKPKPVPDKNSRNVEK